jgi:Xaa-Pro aminopeptidase
MTIAMSRLDRCRGLLDGLGVETLLVNDLADVRYLSGFRGDDATLLVGEKAALICTDARYWDQVHEEVEGFELVEVRGELLSESVGALRSAGRQGRLGIQGAALSYASYRAVRRRHGGGLRDVGAAVTRLRAVKDAAEITVMRRAAQVTDAALAAAVAGGLIGCREVDVAWRLQEEYHRLGAEGEAFPAIVAGGAHGAQAHAIPGEHVIAAGELVVIDTGARVDGYCSDITRTYAAGEPGDGLRRVYDVVLAAQLAGLAAVRAGAHGRDDVDAACRSVIAAAGYGAQFGHGTGHGVGLEVHESPGLGRTRGDELAAGMVCTVEPGIYVDGLAGVRIEDTVLVTDGGCERLTTSPRELQVVD